MLGPKIKEYLDDNGLRYSHIANKVNIPMPVFSAILNGKRNIKAEEYFEICDALGLDKGYFAPRDTA